MCTSKPKVPKVVERDPVAEAAAAEAAAQGKANAETAARRKRLRNSSLMTIGPRGLSGGGGGGGAYAAYATDNVSRSNSLGGT